MKAHEFEKIVTKLDLKVRNSRDRLAWFEYEGRTVVRTRRSHGNKEAPEHLIRQQLKLNEREFAGLIRCTVSKDDYVEILTRKKIIAHNPPNLGQNPTIGKKKSR
ncbi:MAG: hypothetical protein WB819_08655 [Terriglobia bacterium]|jgi:hypothetical protein